MPLWYRCGDDERSSGEEQSSGHELGFVGTSWFMRKKAGARTDLLRLVGTVDRSLIYVVYTVKMHVW